VSEIESTNHLLEAMGIDGHFVAVNIPDPDVDDEYTFELALAYQGYPEPLIYIYSKEEQDPAGSILDRQITRTTYEVTRSVYYPGGRDEPPSVDIEEVWSGRRLGEAVKQAILCVIAGYIDTWYEVEAERSQEEWERDHAIEIEEARNNAEGYLMERDAEAYAADPEGYMARGDLAYDAAHERGEV